MGTSAADKASYDTFLADLFGVMAYGELSAFERLSSDARYSPTLHDRAVLGRIAVAEFQHYELVSARLAEMGIDVEDAMLPFQPAVDHFHERTKPGDWYESLMKAYVVDAVASDFYRAVSAHLDEATRELIEKIQTSDSSTSVLRDLLKKGLADDPRLASRLALWGRRLLGEALTQAQRVGMEHAFLVSLLSGRTSGGVESGPSETGPGQRETVSELLQELVEGHSRRMVGLGLTG
jgi:hypothetical protein